MWLSGLTWAVLLGVCHGAHIQENSIFQEDPLPVEQYGEPPATSTIPLYDCSTSHRKDENDESVYEVLQNGEWWSQACEKGLIWNQQKCRCEFPDGTKPKIECRGYRASESNHAGKYEQYVNGQWTVRDCSLSVAGLVWSQDACQCVWGPDSKEMITGQGITPCDIMLNMTFEDGVKDLAKGSFVEVARGMPLDTHVVNQPGTDTTGRYAAHFTDTAINIWHFAGNEMGTSLRVEFKFKVTNNLENKNSYQMFISNGCDVTASGYTTPSLAIGYRPADQSYLLAFETASARKAIVCQRQLGAYDWHTVSLIYEDGTLLMRIDGHPCIISQDFTGAVQKTSCPLTIGADPLERESMYQGYLDDLVIARYCRRYMDRDPEDGGEEDSNPMPMEAMKSSDKNSANQGGKQYQDNAGEQIQSGHQAPQQYGKAGEQGGPYMSEFRAKPAGPSAPKNNNYEPHAGVRSSKFISTHYGYRESKVAPMGHIKYLSETDEEPSAYDDESDYPEFEGKDQVRIVSKKSEDSREQRGGYQERRPTYKQKPSRQRARWFDEGNKSSESNQGSDYASPKADREQMQRYEYEHLLSQENKNIRRYGEPLTQQDSQKPWFKRENNGQAGSSWKFNESSKSEYNPEVGKVAAPEPSKWYKKTGDEEQAGQDYEEIPQYDDAKDYGEQDKKQVVVSQKEETFDNAQSMSNQEKEKESIVDETEKKWDDYEDEYATENDYKDVYAEGTKAEAVEDKIIYDVDQGYKVNSGLDAKIGNKEKVSLDLNADTSGKNTLESKVENQNDYQQMDYYADYDGPYQEKLDSEGSVYDTDNTVVGAPETKAAKIPKNKRWFKKPSSQSQGKVDSDYDTVDNAKGKSNQYAEESLLEQYKPYDGQKFERMYGSVLAKSLESERQKEKHSQTFPDYGAKKSIGDGNKKPKRQIPVAKPNPQIQEQPPKDISVNEGSWKPSQNPKTKPVQRDRHRGRKQGSFGPERSTSSRSYGNQRDGRRRQQEGKQVSNWFDEQRKFKSSSIHSKDSQVDDHMTRYGSDRPESGHRRQENSQSNSHQSQPRHKSIRWSRQLYTKY